MSAILYMLRKSLKNNILELLHHPVKMILYLFVAAMLVFSAVTMATPSEDPLKNIYLDRRILDGIYLALLLLVTVPTLMLGMNSGTTLFNMSDVNMLFVAPVSSKKILLYGLVKQMGTTLLVSFFLLAYGGIAVDKFGITIQQALLLLVGFGLMIFVAQILTMLIYSFVNGNEHRIRAVKYTVYLLLLLVVGYVGLIVYQKGLNQENFFAAISDPVLEYLPFVGWMKGLLFAVLNADTGRLLLFAILLGAGLLASILLFLRSDADYYEDVLQNTESTYAMRQAVKEGRVAAKTVNNRAPKVRATGLNGGWGASAFFFKQMREIRRRSPLVFLSGSTLLLLVACVFMAFIIGNGKGGENGMSANLIMMCMLIMSVYILFFLNAAGEWGREIMKPYLYMVPEHPLKKLIWASLTSLIKPLVDGAIVFTVAGVVLRANPFTVIICVLMYTSFGFVFTGCNILSQRVLGQMANKGLIMVLYMLLVLAIMAPGPIIGAILYFTVHIPAPAMGIPVFLWNTAVSVGVYALSQSTLHDMEVL